MVDANTLKILKKYIYIKRPLDLFDLLPKQISLGRYLHKNNNNLIK